MYQAASGAIPDFTELCSAKFHVPGTKAQELRVWLHRVTPQGQSEHLPALVKVSSGKDIQEFHTDGAGKHLVFRLHGAVKKGRKGKRREESPLAVEVQLADHSA